MWPRLQDKGLDVENTCFSADKSVGGERGYDGEFLIDDVYVWCARELTNGMFGLVYLKLERCKNLASSPSFLKGVQFFVTIQFWRSGSSTFITIGYQITLNVRQMGPISNKHIYKINHAQKVFLKITMSGCKLGQNHTSKQHVHYQPHDGECGWRKSWYNVWYAIPFSGLFPLTSVCVHFILLLDSCLDISVTFPAKQK